MVFAHYLYWHYFVAPGGIVRLLKNYMAGTWHRYSIGRHFRTLFAPWHRALPSQLPEARTVGTRLSAPLVDLVVRFFAAGIRSSIIGLGLIKEFFLIAGFLIFILLWIFWPVIVLLSIGLGLKLLS